jgi:hypothetical protein
MQTPRPIAAVTALVLGLAACADSPSAPSPRGAPDITGALASTVAVAFAAYFPGADQPQLPTQCPWAAAVRAFVCAPAVNGDLAYTLSYTLLDADGRTVGERAEHAVAMRVAIDARGTRTTTNGDARAVTTLVEQRDLLVGGLRTDELTVSGTTAARRDLVGSGGVVPRVLHDLVGRLSGVRIARGGRWPVAGTVSTSDVSVVERPGAPPLTSRGSSSLEFDGTSIVTLTTTIDGVSLRCRFDLDGRVATTCS